MPLSVRGTPEEIRGICGRSEETLGQRSKNAGRHPRESGARRFSADMESPPHDAESQSLSWGRNSVSAPLTRHAHGWLYSSSCCTIQCLRNSYYAMSPPSRWPSGQSRTSLRLLFPIRLSVFCHCQRLPLSLSPRLDRETVPPA